MAYCKNIGFECIAILVLIGFLANFKSKAQDLASIGKENPVTISGGLSASQIFYGVKGIDSRRDPYSYFLTGNLNLALYGWSVPFSFSLSNQNHSFQQPFNQFGLHPTYKWATAHIGYANMSFSPYTLSGHIFRGAGVELVPGKFHFSAMVGQLQRAVQVDSLRNAIPAFERNGFGFKTGYRDGGDFAELSLFHGKDNVNSLAVLPNDNSLLPEENLAIGISMGKSLFDKFSIQVDFGSSAITRDARDEGVNGRIPFSAVGGLFTPRLSTSYYNAHKVGFNYTGSSYTLGIGYERIDPGYRTHGTYYFNNDMVSYTINGSTSLLENKLSLSANVGLQHDNLDDTKISTQRRFVGAVNASYSPTERLSLSTSYSNFQSFTNIRSQFVDINQLTPFDNLDTLKFTQVTQSINASTNYILSATKEQRQMIFLNISVQDAAEKQSQVEENGGSQFYNVNASYSLSLIPTNLTLSFSYNMNQNKMPMMDLFTHGPTASINKALMERKLRLSLSTSYNTTSQEGIKQNSVTNIRGNASYLLAKKHNFGLSLMSVNRSMTVEMGPSSFNEYTGTLVYSYSF